MAAKIGGTLQRPRVAIVGEFDDETHKIFHQKFPTIWEASSFSELSDKVSPRDLDLILIASDIDNNYEHQNAKPYLPYADVICFSENMDLLGPIGDCEINAYNRADSIQYEFPDISILLNRQRELDFTDVTSIRGWNIIGSLITRISGESQKSAEERYKANKQALFKAAIVVEHMTQEPLAVIFTRNMPGNFKVAWLPNPVFKPSAWVELICLHWAEYDRDRYPLFGNWLKNQDWMVPEEITLQEEIHHLESRRQEIIREIDLKLAEVSHQLTGATILANSGRRRLITAQGKELVDEVSLVFQDFGFTVENMDDETESSQSKREDLRLKTPNDPNWEAIVEVRGYSRASCQTSDLQRLGRFASLYQREKGKLPDLRIYIVNGEIEVPNPSLRHEPFAAAKEDLETFAEDDGVVIGSLDLFKNAKMVGETSLESLRNSIIHARGRWKGL